MNRDKYDLNHLLETKIFGLFVATIQAGTMERRTMRATMNTVLDMIQCYFITSHNFITTGHISHSQMRQMTIISMLNQSQIIACAFHQSIDTVAYHNTSHGAQVESLQGKRQVLQLSAEHKGKNYTFARNE